MRWRLFERNFFLNSRIGGHISRDWKAEILETGRSYPLVIELICIRSQILPIDKNNANNWSSWRYTKRTNRTKMAEVCSKCQNYKPKWWQPMGYAKWISGAEAQLHWPKNLKIGLQCCPRRAGFLIQYPLIPHIFPFIYFRNMEHTLDHIFPDQGVIRKCRGEQDVHGFLSLRRHQSTRAIVMRMLALCEHKAFKVATLHSVMHYIHVTIRSASFSLIGFKLEFLWLFEWNVFKIFYHCRCTSVTGQNQDCVISIVCTKFRVRLAHLRCNLQNMTSLVCHRTECTHTQYVPVFYGWLYIHLFCLLIQYRKLFWKVLRNNLKIFNRKIGKFCGEFRGIFPKILRIISKNIKNHFKKFLVKFRKILRNTSEIFEKYFRKC